MNILKSAGLHALIETLPLNERYSYNFDGNAQALDHILVSGNLFDHAAAGSRLRHRACQRRVPRPDLRPRPAAGPADDAGAGRLRRPRSPAPNAAGWNNCAVTVSLRVRRPAVGARRLVPRAPVIARVGGRGSGGVAVRRRRRAGSSLSAGVSNVDIDLTDADRDVQRRQSELPDRRDDRDHLLGDGCSRASRPRPVQTSAARRRRSGRGHTPSRHRHSTRPATRAVGRSASPL